MSRAPLLLLAFLSTAFAAMRYPKYNESFVGRYKLAKIDVNNPPIGCKDFMDACIAEKEGRYGDAMRLYEAKYATCGDFGWSTEGYSDGSYYTVVFKTTPCGMPVAVKGLQTPKDCLRLKELTTGASYSEVCL
jgi:hypothetical protein